MKYAVDHISLVGTQHNLCEDYSLSGFSSQGNPYLIVCDGCSGSKYTDIGSRLLAFITQRVLCDYLDAGERPDEREFGNRMAQMASAPLAYLNLPYSTLDATLMICFVIDQNVYVYVYGDGVVGIQHTYGVHNCFLVDSGDRPYYPSYSLQRSRLKQYLSERKTDCDVEQYNSGTDGWLQQASYSRRDPETFVYSISEVSAISICSDGVSRMLKKDTQYLLPTYQVVLDLMNYKSRKGVFVQRRVKSYLRKNSDVGIYPYDDVSMATLLIEKEKSDATDSM